jgi:Zn-dependent protease/tetratricopeptide (TPR) repeat protein
MNFLWLAIAWVMLFVGLRYGLTVIMLTRSRFGVMSGEVVATAQVPEYIRNLLEISTLDLQRLGFRDCGYIQYTPFLQLHPAQRWMQVLVDKSGSHFATIELRYPVAASDPFSISFYTWFTDGHLVMTVDRVAYAIVDRIPNTTLGDNRLRNLDRQWDFHRQQSAQIGDRVANKYDIGGFSDRYFAHFAAYIDRLIATKIFIPVADGSQYKRALSRTFYVAYQLIYHRPKPQPIAQSIAIPPEITIDNSRMLEQSQTSTSSRRSKFWWFGVSAIAFFVATIPYMGWDFGVQILAIILLHELGHLLAMQLFGYRNTSMLFIPFFGGVAMGKNEQATLSQKFWVLILGPLPGILLGIAMLIASYSNPSWSWWHGFGVWMVGINLLNLLPIYPLDGGKIVGLLLQPYPYIGVGFKLICAVLAIGLWLSGSQVFLFIGSAIVMSLPLDLRTARAIARLKRQPGAADLAKDDWFKWAYDRLDAGSQPPAKPAQQLLFMNNLWEWRSDLHNATGVRWGLGLLYTCSLIGGTLGSAYGLMGNHLPMFANRYIDDWQTGKMTPAQRKAYYRTKWQHGLQSTTAQIDRDSNNIKAYRQRLKLHRLLQDNRGAMQDLDRLIAIDPGSAVHLYERLSLHQRLAQYRAALLDTDLLLQLNPRSPSDTNRQQLTSAFDLDRAMQFHPQLQAHLHYTRGDLYTKLGEIDLAIAIYSTYLSAPAQPNAASPSRYLAYLERSKLYAQTEKPQLALADLDKAIASEPKFASGAYLESAKLRDRSGDRAGAKLDRQIATELDAKNLKDSEDL